MSEIFQTSLWKKHCFKDCFVLATDRLTQAVLIVAVGWGLVYLRLFSVTRRGFCSWRDPSPFKKENVYVGHSDPPRGSGS